jgi:hypothetical protein
MGYPFWVTSNLLGTKTAGSSLTLDPIQLVFGESDQLSCTAQLLNGTLPPGITFTQNAYVITLTGVLPFLDSPGSEVTSFISLYEFTFRVSNGTYVADRTFKIALIQEYSVFEWVTPNLTPLLYVYDDQTQSVQIQARSEPRQPITYTCTNLASLTQGITLVANSGVFSLNVAWKPLTAYTQDVDYVYHNNQLYVCVISGTSNSTQGPLLSGSNVVDSAYAAWQPQRIYNLNSVVTNDAGKIYVCIISGESSANPGEGPTGQGNNILDNSCYWAYQGQSLVWNQVPTNTEVSLSLACMATVGTSDILRTFEIQLVSREAAPIWLTPPGQLLTLLPEQLFAYDLQVQDPDQTLITWSSLNLPSWMQLSIIGELSGQAPVVTQDTTFTFDVSVTDQIHTNSQTFSILVTQQSSTLAWITGPDLGTISDGVISYLGVQSQSPLPGAAITYGWCGGMLPEGLTLNNQNGQLQGFVEYHGENKTYYFEIQSNDGVNRIQRMFQVTVTCANLGTYWSLYMPVWGDFKNQILVDNNNSLIPDRDLFLLNEPVWGRNSKPVVTIISGLKACGVTEFRNLISNYMHEWVMNFNKLQQTTLPAIPFSTLDAQVRDAVGAPLWSPNTFYAVNARVSTHSGAQYQATVAGKSGANAPKFNTTTVTDNQITWQLLSSPNLSTSRTAPLPWYPYHAYVRGETISTYGSTYVNIQAGRSGGAWPHVAHGQTIVTDNQASWQRVSAAQGNNTYWPSCVVNMRRVLTQNLPWSNSWGTGAQAVFEITANTGACFSVTMTAPGTSYFHAPPVQILTQTGSGAQLQAFVGILKAEVVESTIDVPQLLQFDLDLGNGTSAQLQVAEVNQYNQATKINVLFAGVYTQVPEEPIQIQLGSAIVKLKLSVGVVQVSIINPGSGYAPADRIDFSGQEWDPVRSCFIDQFDLNMCLAFVIKPVILDVERLPNPYKGSQIPVKQVQADLQGVIWQGKTRFDSDGFTCDANGTRFVETTPAIETIWDQNELVWDSQVTTFDRRPRTAYPVLSQTVFDQDHTLFDWYSTTFDQRIPTYESRWKASYVWFMGTHQ